MPTTFCRRCRQRPRHSCLPVGDAHYAQVLGIRQEDYGRFENSENIYRNVLANNRVIRSQTLDAQRKQQHLHISDRKHSNAKSIKIART